MTAKYNESPNILQAKLETVEKFQFFLSEKLSDINKDNLKEEFEKLSLEFHKSIADEYTAMENKHKASRPVYTANQRYNPTAYNTFIRERMNTLKIMHPDKRNTTLMTMAATDWNETDWNEFKKTKAAAASV